MSIDWITVLAQIINLLVLAFILKKLLYRPVLNMIDQRQALIDAEIQKAQDATKAAQKDAAEYAQQIRQFKAQKQARLQQVEAEAGTLKSTLTTEAKQAVSARKKQWEKDLAQEQEAFNVALRNKIAQQFVVLAQDVFKDMADTSLQEQMQNCFLKKLKALPKRTVQQLTQKALQAKKVQLILAMPYTAKQTQQLVGQIKKLLALPASIRITTETDKKAICGLSLIIKDECVNWSLADYLDTLAHNLTINSETTE